MVACSALLGGKRPTPLNTEIDAERKKLEEAHQVAKESNSALKVAVEMHLDQLRLLSRPLSDLQREVPSMADLDEESEASIAEVRRILSKVDEMKSQRTQLSAQLRDAIHADDVTKRLVAFTSANDRGGTETEEEKRQACPLVGSFAPPPLLLLNAFMFFFSRSFSILS